MDLLEEYSNLLASIKNLSDEIPELRGQIRMYEKMLAKHQRDKADLEIERSRKQTSLMNEELNRLTALEYNKINKRQAEIDSKLSVLASEHTAALQRISQDLYESELSRKYAMFNKLSTTLQKYTLPSSIPPELLTIVSDNLAETKQKYSEEALIQLIDDVHAAYDGVDMHSFDNEGGFSAFIDFISLKRLNEANMQNRTKLYVFFAYLLALVIECLVVPVIPIILLGGEMILTYRRYIQDNKRWIEFILPYSSLENGMKFLKSEIDTAVQNYRNRNIADENDRYQVSVTPLTLERAQLEAEYTQAAEMVRSTISAEELHARVEQQFVEAMSKCDKDIKETERHISRIQKFIRNNEMRLPKLKDKQKELLAKIKEAYLNPKEPGSSRRLTKSFFLGINEKQGSLIEFKYDGNTTLIMYKGEDCRTNKDLISMMLMQLLSSMSMTSLNIYLTDSRSAGSDYAVFFQEELSGKMHLCATDGDVTKAINELHSELIMRTKDILTEAESLEQYNEAMIARKSLPREYIIFLLQDPSPRDMEKQELQELLFNGPTVGIIPIVFLRHADIMDGFGINSESLTAVLRFFQAFNKCSFTFDGATSDLTATPDLSITIMSMLRKGKKSR